MRKDRLYAAHIVESVEMIQRWVATDPAGILDNDMMQEAVLRRLQTLAESSKRLSEEAKARHPEVEWRRIADFRNVIVHDYMTIRLSRVAEIIETDLPPLLIVARQILAALP